jgi:outer membrane lipoprotein-sorting protein
MIARHPRTSRRHVVHAAVWLVSALVVAGAAAQAPNPTATLTVDSIVEGVAAQAQGAVRFREVRSLKLLKEPMVTTGVLRFKRPDRLERIVTAPVAESMVIEGGTLIVERDGVQTVLVMDDRVPAIALIRSLTAVLQGNAARLRELNDVSAEGSVRQWTLSLRPRDSTSPVDRIRMVGHGTGIDRIELDERSGNRTAITLEQ